MKKTNMITRLITKVRYEIIILEIQKIIDRIVNKNDLKAKQNKLKEENPIRRSERTRNKTGGVNYYDDGGKFIWKAFRC